MSACSKCSAITQDPNSSLVIRLVARPVLPPGRAKLRSHSPTQKSMARYSAPVQGGGGGAADGGAGSAWAAASRSKDASMVRPPRVSGPSCRPRSLLASRGSVHRRQDLLGDQLALRDENPFHWGLRDVAS